MTDAPDPGTPIDPGPRRPTPPWYRRRALMWSVGVVVVVGAAVIGDLPHHASRGEQISSAASIVSQVNSAVSPCAYAVQETFTIEQTILDGTISKSDRGRVSGYLRDDQDACAFTSSSIDDLANIEVPGSGSGAGDDLGNLVDSATLWSTSDALAAIEAIQTLTSNPSDAKAQTNLSNAENMLTSDRNAVIGELAAADRSLDTTLANVPLPALPRLVFPPPS